MADAIEPEASAGTTPRGIVHTHRAGGDGAPGRSG